MSYSAGETLILAAVRTCTGFSATNTSRGNWQMISKGTSDHYAIIRLGNSSVEFVTVNRYHARYTTVIELWQRYTDDGTSLTNLYGYLANLLTGLQAYARLGDTGGTVISAGLSSVGEPEEMWQSGGGPAWLRILLSLSWVEESAATFI